MGFFDAIVLGVVQGVTEFLPISSSGHLILAREVLGIESEHGLAVDAVLQMVTACTVILYFRHDLARLFFDALRWIQGLHIAAESRVMIFALALGTLPAVVAGLFLEEAMDTIFRDPSLVAWVLIAGSGLLVCAEWVYAKRERTASSSKDEVGNMGQGRVTVPKAFAIGCFQALALIPGVSRSGATISGGMLLGLAREQAARFAFLLSVPIIVGAGSKKLLELGGADLAQDEWHMIALASFFAFSSGLASIHYLLKYLRNHSLLVFVVYRVALAMLVFAVL